MYRQHIQVVFNRRYRIYCISNANLSSIIIKVHNITLGLTVHELRNTPIINSNNPTRRALFIRLTIETINAVDVVILTDALSLYLTVTVNMVVAIGVSYVDEFRPFVVIVIICSYKSTPVGEYTLETLLD